MRRAVPARRTRPAVLGGLVVAVALAGTAFGTWSAFTDTDPAPSGRTGAATVVLGGRSAPPTLTFTGLRAGTGTTLPLTIDYRGSVPATISLTFPSTTATSCVKSGSTYSDGALVGSLTVGLGSRTGESWCGLLDAKPRVVLATLAPSTTTTVPVTVTPGAVLLASRTEQAVLRVSSAGGFTDQIAGTIRITTSALLGGKALVARAPSPTVVTVPAGAITPPAECTAAGMTAFSEVITLSGTNRSFVASRDRPGSAGPFLVVGGDGDDTVVGSSGADCVTGGAGADTVDGAGGDDVIVGGDGDDRLTGGDGADRLSGGAGADTLTGGPGPDVLDGGPDVGTCADAAAEDTVTACTVPAGTAAAPEAPAVPVPSEQAPPGPVTEGGADPGTTTVAPPAPVVTTTAGDPAPPAPGGG